MKKLTSHLASCVRKLIWLLVICLVASTSASAGEQDEWVPAGFEGFDQPQRTVVDIYYGGYFLTSVWATYTTDTIVLEDVQKIIAGIPGIKRHERLAALLKEEQPINADRLCGNESAVGCGVLDVEELGFIFDVQQLRADLFLGEALLDAPGSKRPAFLPPTEAGLSLVNDMSLFFSGTDRSDTRYNLNDTMVISHGENRLFVQIGLSDTGGFTADRLSFQRDFRGRSYEAGVLRARSDNFLFMKDTLSLGVSLGSSMQTRMDLRDSLGTDIVLYLNARSRVEVFRDGRLLSAGYYDVGNQRLNLSELPDGAYDIDIRITDSTGSVREESRFFSRNSRLPVAEQPDYFFQLGEILDDASASSYLHQPSGEFYMRAGTSRRLSDRIGLHLGGVYQTSSMMAEAGLHYLGQNLEMRMALAYDSEKSAGIDAQLRYTFPAGFLQFSTRHIAVESSTNQPRFSATSLDRERSQIQLSAGIRTDYGLFSPFYRHSRRANETSENFGMRWLLPPLFGQRNISSSLEISSNNGDSAVLFSFSYRFGSGRWQHNSSARYRLDEGRRSQNTGFEASMSSLWRSDRIGGNEYQWEMRADSGENARLSSRFGARGDLGEANLTLDYSPDRNSLAYNGSIRTMFAASSQGAAIGGGRRHTAGYLVSLQGFEPDAEWIDIQINGVKRASLPPNSSRFVPVQEFGVHELRAVTRGTELYQLDQHSFVHSFYPGNVMPVEISAARLIVILGRVINEAGQPVPEALIKGVEGIATSDANGFFQAEVLSDAQALVVVSNGKQCQLSLSLDEVSDTVTYVGDVVCRGDAGH